MLLPIPDVLTSEQVAEARQILEQADWVDGRVTAGHQSAKDEDNMQLPENHPAARQLAALKPLSLPLTFPCGVLRGFSL